MSCICIQKIAIVGSLNFNYSTQQGQEYVYRLKLLSFIQYAYDVQQCAFLRQESMIRFQCYMQISTFYTLYEILMNYNFRSTISNSTISFSFSCNAQWRSLDMSGVERRRLFCAVLFHLAAALCVIWSLCVLIERSAEEVMYMSI